MKCSEGVRRSDSSLARVKSISKVSVTFGKHKSVDRNSIQLIANILNFDIRRENRLAGEERQSNITESLTFFFCHAGHLLAIAENPKLHIQHTFQPGEIEIISNQVTLHSRGEIHDGDVCI